MKQKDIIKYFEKKWINFIKNIDAESNDYHWCFCTRMKKTVFDLNNTKLQCSASLACWRIFIVRKKYPTHPPALDVPLRCGKHTLY